jgi:uncharacterized 2Fe-2S/4Fe-4S cluster protein (DUF4445 family)
MPSFRRLSTVPEKTADDLHTCPKITMAAHVHTVTFLPENKRIRVAHLKTIFETIGEENPEGVQLFFSCGAEGICPKCKALGPLTATEKGCLSEAELARGIRLACQARIVQDSQVEILYKRPFTIMLTDEDIDVQGPERLRKIIVAAPEGCQPDADTLLQAAVRAGVAVSFETLKAQMSVCLMNGDIQKQALWTAVFFDGRLIALEPGDTSAMLYAAAVDLGTNTLEVSLIDAARGRKIAVVTDSNPQIELGDTYEARLAMVEDDALNLEILNEEIILRIDLLIYELCAACSVSPLQVYEILIAGGTGMLHLFLMRAPGPLEQRAAGSYFPGRLTAGQLELRSTAQAGISLLPAIGLYAGADITAAILATRLHRSDTTTLLLDLGGSSKAVLYHNGRLLACVAGRTTVFDAAGLSCGMRPEAGAVTGVRLSESGDCAVDVIGESLPRGVSAAGLLELAAFLRRQGALDYQGNFIHAPDKGQTPLARRLTVLGDEPAFVLYSDPGEFATDIYVTRRDIFRLRDARARVAALIEYVCAMAGTAPGDITQVLVSGTLGGAPSGSILADLGFLPAELAERTVFIGNASKHGAQLALLDMAVADEAEELARRVEYVAYPDYEPPESVLHF